MLCNLSLGVHTDFLLGVLGEQSSVVFPLSNECF